MSEDITHRLRNAQALLAKKQPGAAIEIVRDILSDEPDDTEAIYTLAVAQRQAHSPEQALETLRRLLAIKSKLGRAHQEAGYNLLALKDMTGATASFELAVANDPGLINSWKSLIQLYGDAGKVADLERAREQVRFLESLPPELLTVISYMAEDRLVDAERLCRYFLRSNKTHVEGMRLLAEIATRSNILDDAEFIIESAVEFEPDHRNARIQYAHVLLRTQKFAKAFEQASMLMQQHPDDVETIKSLYASAAMGVGENDIAIKTYLELMTNSPDNHFYPLSLAHVLKSDGDFDAAVQMYHKASEIKPDYGDAWWSLANTKSYRFTEAEISEMVKLVSNAAPDSVDHAQLCFALGKAYEDREAFAESMQYYELGNTNKKESTHHSREQLGLRVDSQIEVCDRALLESKQGLGHPAPDPIFIVGMPRAGSTLLEQILSSHSAVDGTMELHNILNLAKRLRGRTPSEDDRPRYPGVLRDLSAEHLKGFGEQFINDTRAYRGDAPFFIDKMPNNFFHIGLIRLILPKAKIIDARRHPMACCFSGYKQLFGEGQEFSYDLADIGNYYRRYVELMDHWDEVLPGFVLRVQYEDVVDDIETQVRRILDFCELPFEAACVDFYKTKRSIRTPSAEQVRQPIYKSGLEQWRNYEPWLDPLKDALGPEILAPYPTN